MLDFFQILTMIYQILTMLANLLWGPSSEALKLLVEMALAGEADLQGDVCDRQIRFRQHQFRPFHPLLNHVLMG